MDGVSGGKFRKKRVNFSMVSNEILRDKFHPKEKEGNTFQR